jgi:hypothetical protein
VEQQCVKSQQDSFQFKECAQQFVRMDNVATTFAMGIDDPTPAVRCDGATIPRDQPAALSLSATISQYCMLLHGLRQNRFTNYEEKAQQTKSR